MNNTTNAKDFSKDVFDEIIRKLSENGVKIDVSELDSEPDISPELLDKLMSRPVPFEVNDYGELTVTVDGEVSICA